MSRCQPAKDAPGVGGGSAAELKRQAAARNGREYVAALRGLFRLGAPHEG